MIRMAPRPILSPSIVKSEPNNILSHPRDFCNPDAAGGSAPFRGETKSEIDTAPGAVGEGVGEMWHVPHRWPVTASVNPVTEKHLSVENPVTDFP
jgi:hypothetical protein